MPFASKNVVRTWLFIAIVSITAVTVLGSGEKRLDLKIGFDITQGANGAPSLRIRDFEDAPEASPRAKESAESKEAKPDESKEDKADDSLESKPTISKVRADSFSDSDEKNKGPRTIKRESSKESKESAKSNNEDDDDDDDSSGDKKRLSTRGLAGEYEPEENPKFHHNYQSGEDSDRMRHRRRKRYAFFDRWREFGS